MDLALSPFTAKAFLSCPGQVLTSLDLISSNEKPKGISRIIPWASCSLQKIYFLDTTDVLLVFSLWRLDCTSSWAVERYYLLACVWKWHLSLFKRSELLSVSGKLYPLHSFQLQCIFFSFWILAKTSAAMCLCDSYCAALQWWLKWFLHLFYA